MQIWYTCDTFAEVITHSCKHVGHLKGSSSLLSVAAHTLKNILIFSRNKVKLKQIFFIHMLISVKFYVQFNYEESLTLSFFAVLGVSIEKKPRPF